MQIKPLSYNSLNFILLMDRCCLCRTNAWTCELPFGPREKNDDSEKGTRIGIHITARMPTDWLTLCQNYVPIYLRFWRRFEKGFSKLRILISWLPKYFFRLVYTLHEYQNNWYPQIVLCIFGLIITDLFLYFLF